MEDFFCVPPSDLSCTVHTPVLSKPGVNFINILRTAFVHAEPKSVKDSQVVSLFALSGFSGFACAKAASKYVGEIDPRQLSRSKENPPSLFSNGVKNGSRGSYLSFGNTNLTTFFIFCFSYFFC